MPSLMLRDLPAELVDQVRAYARANEISLPAAAEKLLWLGLKSDELLASAADELQEFVDAIKNRPLKDGGG